MSAQRRQRETWEHKGRADSCMECHAVCGAVSVRPAVLPLCESSGAHAMSTRGCVKNTGSQQYEAVVREETTTEAPTVISLIMRT